MDGLRATFSALFNGKGSNRPHSTEYREFKQKWGLTATIYEMASDKITELDKIYRLYLADFLQYLSYCVEKQQVDDIEDKWQENRRKAMRGR